MNLNRRLHRQADIPRGKLGVTFEISLLDGLAYIVLKPNRQFTKQSEFGLQKSFFVDFSEKNYFIDRL